MVEDEEVILVKPYEVSTTTLSSSTSFIMDLSFIFLDNILITYLDFQDVLVLELKTMHFNDFFFLFSLLFIFPLKYLIWT